MNRFILGSCTMELDEIKQMIRDMEGQGGEVFFETIKTGDKTLFGGMTAPLVGKNKKGGWTVGDVRIFKAGKEALSKNDLEIFSEIFDEQGMDGLKSIHG
ncbi:MAG: hypothetical protein WCW30_01805, partial [Candidatus Gracilibacteria bacterium]